MHNAGMVGVNAAHGSHVGTVNFQNSNFNNTNFQNTNTPDIDLERDLVDPEIALGIEAGKLSTEQKFQVNISTIIMSALIFLAILAWFDFLQTVFYNYFVPETLGDTIPSSVKLWYAFLVTIIVMILVVLIYYTHRSNIM